MAKRKTKKVKNGREKLLLVVKLLGFTGVALWTFGWAAVLVALFDGFINAVKWLGNPIMDGFLQLWYVGTFVYVGAWAAKKGYLLVGKWEQPKIRKPRTRKKK